MIDPIQFRERLGVEYYAGVPDSLLADFAPVESDLVAPNEGSAVALAAGYHLATGKIGCVYLQGSGLGNAINPLVSLAHPDVYSIPMLLVIGWRGAPGEHDEPQHAAEGRTLFPLLKALEIPAEELPTALDAADRCAAKMLESIEARSAPGALVIRRGTFSPRKLERAMSPHSMTRERAIELVIAATKPDDLVVCTTGMASRELFELRERTGGDHSRDFLNLGAMGHASAIALAMAEARADRRVWLLDGDGAALMHLGTMALIGARAPRNLIHIVLNNSAHASVGGQPTAAPRLEFTEVAKACGYSAAAMAGDEARLQSLLKDATGPALIEARVNRERRADLGRPAVSPLELKRRLCQVDATRNSSAPDGGRKPSVRPAK